MKNIEAPLTWVLAILAIVLIIIKSLSSTSMNSNINDVKCDENNSLNLDIDHEIQDSSSYNFDQKIINSEEENPEK